jgi:hypothetical protein
MNADVVDDEVCGAVCRDAGADPREGAQRWDRRPERNDRDGHDGKDERKQVVRVDATPPRAVVRAVPPEPATVHQHSVGNGSEALHRNEGAQHEYELVHRAITRAIRNRL